MIITLISILALAAPAQDNIKPCPTDEGEQRTSCVWDAKHRGNGEGRSFIAGPNGGHKYIAHARAHRLLKF